MMDIRDSHEWVELPCNWCGSKIFVVVFRGPDRLEHLPGEFQIVRCQDCGLLRQHPHLAWESLKTYYPETYASHGLLSMDQPTIWQRVSRRYGSWKRLRAVEKYQKGGELLEVGCGTGTFLEEALRSGRWQVTGIEPTQHAANYVRNKLDIPVIQDNFSKVQLIENSYDVIAMWNVVEHLENPIDDLRYAYRLLKSGGWLVFAIPNLESWDAHVFGKYWVGWDLPRHLYYFSIPMVKRILPTLGFQWIDARCISTSYQLLGHSLDFWSQSWQDVHPLLRRIMLGIYGSLPVRASSLLPLSIMDRLARGPIITIFAQKT